METSKIFGDKNNFAITYGACPDSCDYENKDDYAICYLVINGHFINREGNECWLGPWLYHLTDRRRRIEQTKEKLFPNVFEGLSNREIFELILKANQFEAEYEPEFLYLPKVDNEIWSTHRFELYETTDSYLSYFYVKNNKITFLIEDLTETENEVERSYKFIFHSVELDYFFKTIDEVTNYLVDKFPVLKNKISSREFNSS